MNECVPAAGANEASVAVPEPFTAVNPSEVTPSKNSTLPAGCVVSAAVAVELKVMDVPESIGLALDGVGVVVEVATPLTVYDSADDAGDAVKLTLSVGVNTAV